MGNGEFGFHAKAGVAESERETAGETIVVACVVGDAGGAPVIGRSVDRVEIADDEPRSGTAVEQVAGKAVPLSVVHPSDNLGRMFRTELQRRIEPHRRGGVPAVDAEQVGAQGIGRAVGGRGFVLFRDREGVAADAGGRADGQIDRFPIAFVGIFRGTRYRQFSDFARRSGLREIFRKEPDAVGGKRGACLAKGGVDSGRAAAEDTRCCQTGDRGTKAALRRKRGV